MKYIKGCLIRAWIVVGLCVVAFFLCDGEDKEKGTPRQEQATRPPEPSPKPTDAEPHDDLSLFVSRFGEPDSTYCSEDEVPRPPIVTKWLIYTDENIRAVYVVDAKIFSPPPYHRWSLLGFQNHRTDDPIEPADVVRMMAHRDKNAAGGS